MKVLLIVLLTIAIGLAWNHFGVVDLFNLDLFTRKLIAKKYCPEKDYIDRIFTIYNELKISYYGKN